MAAPGFREQPLCTKEGSGHDQRLVAKRPVDIVAVSKAFAGVALAF